MQRFWWIMGVAVSCAPAPCWAQGVPTGKAAPGASARPVPRATSSATLALAPPEFEEESPSHRLSRETRQFGELLAVGFGTHGLGSKEMHNLLLSGVRFGQVLSHRGDVDRWRHSHFELLGELWGGEQMNRRRRILVGLTPLLRYDFAARGRWVPFADGGVGVAYTNIAGRDLSEGFQFNLQAGLGTHYFFREELALTLQYRWFHLSNAGLNRPNTGLNSQMLFAGVSRFY